MSPEAASGRYARPAVPLARDRCRWERTPMCGITHTPPCVRGRPCYPELRCRRMCRKPGLDLGECP
eukprot:2846932-Prymnesium_polylepis.1